jgi:uncharacterized protein (DUF305 family)
MVKTMDTAHKHQATDVGRRAQAHTKPYATLALMAFLSFIAMFVLMYAMVDRVQNALPNLNQAYMALLMSAPMVLIELVLMRHMYTNRISNMAVIAATLAIGVGAFALIREQVGIGNDQFLASMIPHHAGAILMCEEAPVTDAEIQRLCQSITQGQQAEIAQMKAMLRGSG